MPWRVSLAVGCSSLALLALTPLIGGQDLPEARRRTDTSAISLPGGARVEFVDVESRALKGHGQYSVYLPPSYQRGEHHYPVVYFLHGMFNDHTSWTVDRYGDLPAKVENLMLERKLPEMILVHPNGGQSFYTNYRDGSLSYEDFVVKELPEHVVKTYRTKSGRRFRAIAGTSMGGYGALKIALRYPDLYAAVAAHSPVIFPIRNPLDVPPEVKSSQRFRFFSEVFSSVYGDPLDQAYYDENNPLLLATKAPKDMAIYFDYGTEDRYNAVVHLDEALRKLDSVLTEVGVAHTFRERIGEPHGWALVAAHIEESLGFVSKGF